MEPDYGFSNVAIVVTPFLCYFVGIIIRKIVLPGKDSPPLSHQLLLGIPISLVVVSPLLPVISITLPNTPALLVTLGIIMEHGMIVNETAANHLKTLRARDK